MYLSDVSSRLYAQEDAEIAEGDRAASGIEQQRASDWSESMKEFRALAGREVQVHGDGLCWLYAVLTSMNVLENPSLLTERDRKVLKEFVQDLKRFVRDGGLQKKLTDKEKQQVAELRESPPDRLDTNSYGGGTLFFRVIAAFLQTSIFAVEDGYIGTECFMTQRNAPVGPMTVTGGFVHYLPAGGVGR
jgi:hypothetical protein